MTARPRPVDPAAVDTATAEASVALEARLAALEAEVYRTLIGLEAGCAAAAAQAEALAQPAQALRARLLASDVCSRLGHAAAAKEEQIALEAAAAPWPALARRAAMFLISSCDRIGERVEAMRWAEVAVAPAGAGDPPPWRAEALMVATLFTISRHGADYALIDRAMTAVQEARCSPVLETTTAANFAEAAAECGELVYATHYADLAEAMMRRHPEGASALSWESVARARLAAQELAAAEHAMRQSLALEAQLGCCDVNGDPWLTAAEVRLAREDAAGALSMLDHPRRLARGELSTWTQTRERRVRAHTLAALQRWQEAYGQMLRYVEAYERTRSIEGDRVVAETGAAMAVEEERRRAAHFERLALTDPLTGLPNRRHAERWLAEHAPAEPEGSPVRFAVAIVDLDHFKRINDGCSHDAGDLVLQRVGALLQAVADAPIAGESAALGFAARLGGEEFLLAWSGASAEAAHRACGVLRERLRATSFADVVGDMPVTASIGLACASSAPADTGALLRLADRCLYEAKHAGRDRLVATPLPA